MPSLSVLVNCYNYRQFVVEAVQSVLNQTWVPEQILIVDDGSTDGSVELLTATFGHESRIRIISQRNGGQLSAMVTAFLNATGDIFFLLDADDRYQPNHIERVMSVYESRKDVDFVFTGLQEFGSQTKPQLFRSRDHYFGLSLLRSFNRDEWIGAPTSAVSCRRFVVDALLPLLQEVQPRWRIRADDCLVRGAAAVGARKYFLAETTVDYRVHGSNHHAARDLGAAHHREHWFRTHCFMNRLHAQAGIAPEMLRWLHKEFVLIPEPRWRDYESYLLILKAAHGLSWAVKAGIYWKIRQHYRRNGRPD